MRAWSWHKGKNKISSPRAELNDRHHRVQLPRNSRTNENVRMGIAPFDRLPGYVRVYVRAIMQRYTRCLVLVLSYRPCLTAAVTVCAIPVDRTLQSDSGRDTDADVSLRYRARCSTSNGVAPPSGNDRFRTNGFRRPAARVVSRTQTRIERVLRTEVTAARK